jgi:hypothetical protein
MSKNEALVPDLFRNLKIGDSFVVGEIRYKVTPEGCRCSSVGGTPEIFREFHPQSTVHKVINIEG